jgi:hypothetical protein
MNAYLCFTVALFAQTPEPALRFRVLPDQGRAVVARLPANAADKLPLGRLTPEQGETLLTLSLLGDDKKTPGPTMLGKYERQKNELTFTPRFRLDAGQTYRATLRLPSPPGRGAGGEGKLVTLDYLMPAPPLKSPPTVVKIYPTIDVLPANHLKFYIYFDRPMRGGKELFKHIVLLDDKGNEIVDPWLIDEIWDEENNCLILYIHPGRIKWGVELREILGPVLHEKRHYSLVLRKEWTDIDGNKMKDDVVKKFRTTPEDRVRIDLSQWKLAVAKAGTRAPLTLTLPKPIDHRSLLRFLSVTDDKGQQIDGKIAIDREEKSWHFTPAQAWQNHSYRLEIKGDLEDVAGNTPLRPFDLDLKAPKLPPQKLRFDFQPR